MFETLQKATLDKIFVLMAEYAADPRTNKIDLGVGVYKDPNNNTPIMTSVKKAEQRILDGAKTKTYKGVVGNKEFSQAIVDLALAGVVDASRIRCVNGAGGTGALMILMHVLGRARPGGRIFISDPTWPNHIPLAENANLKVEYYPYFDPVTRKVDFPAMMKVVDSLGSDDILLLHGCCHNPTGANLTNEQWDIVVASLKRTGAFPLVDLAYLGFGDGIDEDAYGVRKVASSLPECMIAFSASKNFGLYRERAGVSIAIAKDAATADVVSSQMQNVIRGTISQTPDHGAEVVRVILEDEGAARGMGRRTEGNARADEAFARQADGSDPAQVELHGFRLHRRAFRHVQPARAARRCGAEAEDRGCGLYDQRQPHQRRGNPRGPGGRTGGLSAPRRGMR